MPWNLRSERFLSVPSPRVFSLQASLRVIIDLATLSLPLVVLVCGCHRESPSSNAAPEPSASVASPVGSAAPDSTIGIPFSETQIAAEVNPGNLPVYRGPFGSVSGKITLRGDPPPPRGGEKPNPIRCGKEASDTYADLFRVDSSGGLADAIVGVTGYKAYVPNEKPVVDVKIRRCTFDQRTIVLMYGQRIEVQNMDVRESYIPHLEGARAPALMVAMPGGDPVQLLPPKPGLYLLQDDLQHPWMTAEVFVLKYPTVAVSDRLGTFKIEKVPVGSLKISVRHPDIRQTLERSIEITEGKNTEVHFEMEYQAPAKAAPSASAPKAPLIH